MAQKEALKKEIEQKTDVNLELQRQNAELAEKSNKFESDFSKEKEKLKEMIQ